MDHSDEDDGQGVILDPANHMSRGGYRGPEAGDELFFTGYDLAMAREGRTTRNPANDNVAYGEEHRYRDEHERYYYEQQRQAMYSRHGELVHSANEKLRKAKEKGKTSVSLSPEEVEALQRSRTPQQREATPPKTPSKGRSSRSSSTASQAGSKKSSKKGSSSRLFGSSSPSASRNKTPKTSRKSSVSEQHNIPPPPAFMIAGPDGVPVYAPVGYYPPPPEDIRPGSGRSRADSRSASSNSRREITPDYEPAYPPYPTRYYGSAADLRSGSSPLNRSPYDDDLRIPRNRSASNAQYGTDYFGMPPMPAVQGRRNVSGPADMYSKAPRMQARSPLAPQPSTSAAQQWPPRTESRPGASPPASSSSSDDDDEGVRVEILPEAHGNGYSIDRRPIGSSSASQVKRRKGRK